MDLQVNLGTVTAEAALLSAQERPVR